MAGATAGSPPEPSGKSGPGGWVEVKTLGSGGFGTVKLWRHEESNEALALKVCRLGSEMTAKHRQRWVMEVQIMQRLDHFAVVKAKIVPKPLDVKENELPVMAMEYCSGGDLRKVLNKPENCCGVREYMIRNIARDVASGVEYLHSKRIIHRDLKPENIVLQETDDRVVYKIIDLGYAKDLDQGSVCTSFVGTLQYLAPELFASQKYTCTVDYWSMGTMIFECITGYRPFLPTVPPVQWHGEVCKKEADHICVYIDRNNEIKYAKKIPNPTHLSRNSLVYFEQWLRLLMQWDPKIRGGRLTDDHRPKCFALLDNMLAMKLVFVMHMTTGQLLTYPISSTCSLRDLMVIIETETKIPIPDQELLLGSGLAPDEDKPAEQCWAEMGEEEWLVFLFNKQNATFPPTQRKVRPMPEQVQIMISEPETLLPFKDQKKTWALAVYFCCEVSRDYRKLMHGQRASMLSLLRSNSNFSKLKARMVTEIGKLMAKIDFVKTSQKIDLEKYEEQAKIGISSNKLYVSWKKMAGDIEKFAELEETVNKLDAQCIGLSTKVVELQRSPFARATKQTDGLERLANESVSLYDQLRQNAREQKHMDNKKMVQCVYECYTQKDRLTNDLYNHLGKIMGCKCDLQKLMPQLTQTLEDIKEAGTKLASFQKQRQTDMWQLIKVAVVQLNALSKVPPANTRPATRPGDLPQRDRTRSEQMSDYFDQQREHSLLLIQENHTASKKLEEMVTSMQSPEEINVADATSPELDWSFLNDRSPPKQGGSPPKQGGS